MHACQSCGVLAISVTTEIAGSLTPNASYINFRDHEIFAFFAVGPSTKIVQKKNCLIT